MWGGYRFFFLHPNFDVNLIHPMLCEIIALKKEIATLINNNQKKELEDFSIGVFYLEMVAFQIDVQKNLGSVPKDKNELLFGKEMNESKKACFKKRFDEAKIKIWEFCCSKF